jgi:methylmalonyl-CoA/ethylmalonyl-CoA epimerase
MVDSGIIKLGNVRQIGIAVRDPAPLIEALSSSFGFNDWKSYVSAGTDAKGRPWKTKITHNQWGPMDFELIQPIEGRILQSSWIEKHGDGIHHIAFPVADVAAATAQIEGRPGFKILLKGPAFTYIEVLGGMIIELVPLRMWNEDTSRIITSEVR